MAGMTVSAAPATGLYTNNGVRGGGVSIGTQSCDLTPSELNDYRISKVIESLLIHLNINSADHIQFEIFCRSLSKSIDFCIANQEVPNRAHELPSLIMKVCQTKTDIRLQAAIMILMISIKSACRNGWFSDRDSEELFNLAKKIASNFSSASDFITEPHPSHQVISTVVSRFYPRLKMGHIFLSLEVKPGFDAYVSDFQIPRNLKCSLVDKIRLFVVQTDSLETSSCLVTPAKVNFLLNGKGVDRRNHYYMETAPQVPTVVTPMLKYGSNLLQAVGEFNGNYVIIVALMSEVPNPDTSTLQNCEQHAPATVDADSEVIEGSSRISLNCPISFKRIKTPVKGVSCNHIQCFDFDNYVDINSRRPSWRCPHCNQHVCFSDIRIDQKMVKVLKEVGPKVSEIIVSSDWSWNAVMESEDTSEEPGDKTLNAGGDESPQPSDVLDLTQTDDPMDVNGACEIEDRKHSSEANAQTVGIAANSVNQSSTHNENDFWTGIYMSTFEMDSVNALPNVQAAGPSTSSSVLTESSASRNREAGAFHHHAVAANSSPQTGVYLPATSQFLQYQHGNHPVLSDYSRLSSVPMHITRTGNAVQALPARAPASFQQRGLANGMGPFTSNGLSAASPAALNSTTNRASPHHVPPISSPSPLLQHSSVQQNHLLPSARPSQQHAGFRDPNQIPNMYRNSSEHQSPSQPINLRVPRSTNQSPGVSQSSMQPSGSLGVSQIRSVHRTGVAGGQQQSYLIANANRAVNMSVGATRAVPAYAWNNTPTPMGDQRSINGAIPSSSQPDANGSADMNWRPTAHMRGALSGQAYVDALNLYITRPTHQAQAARPVSNAIPLPNNGLPNLPDSIAGGTVVGTPLSSSDHVVRPAGSSGIL